MRSLARCSWLVAGLLLGLEGVASANGRFPDAQQLIVDPSDPDHIVAQMTYGFIHTRDGGVTWTWSCEDAAGYGGILDPPIAVVSDGVVIAGVFDGLVVASPDSCDYGFVGGELESRFMLDVSTIKSDPTRAIALSSDGAGNLGFDTRVWKTVDGAESWGQFGVTLPSDFLAFTLDAAADDEDTLYVSGFQVISSNDYVGSLAVSTNAGADWVIKPIPGSENDSGPYIAAIDPDDHDTIYVRLASLAGSLLVTHDAGDTWETIFEGEGMLLGFALSPDGSKIRVGGDLDGLWKASTDDYQFEKISDLGVRCLTWTDEALFACAREAFADFTIGKSFDEGETFTAIHHLNCLSGPDPACPASSTVQSVCLGPWGAQQQVLQTDTCDDGSGGSGTGGNGGAGGSGGGETVEGCSSCTTSSGAAARGWIALIVIGVALARRRRLPDERHQTPGRAP